jgi:DNA end-binding protein Ku
MALRSTWEGYHRLNLLSVPAKAYSATISGKGRIGFHLIHAKCKSRIRYKKVCPIHGEVSNDEIVSGYEIADGKYVLIEKDELAKLRADADKAINIDVFIRPDALDPVYFTDRTYYLTPDGEAARQSYAVLRKVMADDGRNAVATMVLSGRAQVVLIRPVDLLLACTVLNYDTQLKKPAEFETELSNVSTGGAEVKLARTLIEQSTADDFDFGKYQDEYTDHVRALIESKAKGKKIVAGPNDEEPAIINLMDALRESLKETKAGGQRGVRPAPHSRAVRRGPGHPRKVRRARPRKKVG